MTAALETHLLQTACSDGWIHQTCCGDHYILQHESEMFHQILFKTSNELPGSRVNVNLLFYIIRARWADLFWLMFASVLALTGNIFRLLSNGNQLANDEREATPIKFFKFPCLLINRTTWNLTEERGLNTSLLTHIYPKNSGFFKRARERPAWTVRSWTEPNWQRAHASPDPLLVLIL